MMQHTDSNNQHVFNDLEQVLSTIGIQVDYVNVNTDQSSKPSTPQKPPSGHECGSTMEYKPASVPGREYKPTIEYKPVPFSGREYKPTIEYQPTPPTAHNRKPIMEYQQPTPLPGHGRKPIIEYTPAPISGHEYKPTYQYQPTPPSGQERRPIIEYKPTPPPARERMSTNQYQSTLPAGHERKSIIESTTAPISVEDYKPTNESQPTPSPAYERKPIIKYTPAPISGQGRKPIINYTYTPAPITGHGYKPTIEYQPVSISGYEYKPTIDYQPTPSSGAERKTVIANTYTPPATSGHEFNPTIEYKPTLTPVPKPAHEYKPATELNLTLDPKPAHDFRSTIDNKTIFDYAPPMIFPPGVSSQWRPSYYIPPWPCLPMPFLPFTPPTTTAHPYNASAQYGQPHTDANTPPPRSSSYHRNQLSMISKMTELSASYPQFALNELSQTGRQDPNLFPLYSQTVCSPKKRRHPHNGTMPAAPAHKKPRELAADVDGGMTGCPNGLPEHSSAESLTGSYPTDSVQSTNESLNQWFKCVLCCQSKKTTALLPCGHLCICELCGKHVEECPMCLKLSDEKSIVGRR